jgi:two-component system sensor histidine kinase/response regulator
MSTPATTLTNDNSVEHYSVGHDSDGQRIAGQSTASQSPEATGEVAGAAPGVVLIVDDNESNREVLARRLQKQGNETECAADGLEALQKLETRRFDVILLDIMMPVLDGYETLRRLKADERWKHLPVVMISAVGETESIVRCIEMGADDYLPKPFSPALLKARVGACLEKKRAHKVEQNLFAQLQDNFARLQELEQSRDDLVDMIVHDLRSPLTANLAGLEMIEMLGGLNESQHQCVNIALRSGHNLLGLINDLLDISKLEAGALQLEQAALEVRALAQGVLAQIAPLTIDKRLEIASRLPDNLPLVWADEEKLRRILMNLLANAIKFTPAWGRIEVGAQAQENRVLLYVRDSGEGIPPEAIEKIFDKFGQAQARKAGHRMSTGLGLTFCKLAVEAHGGNIWVETEIGRGSTFYFTLPLAEL